MYRVAFKSAFNGAPPIAITHGARRHHPPIRAQGMTTRRNPARAVDLRCSNRHDWAGPFTPVHPRPESGSTRPFSARYRSRPFAPVHPRCFQICCQAVAS